MKKIIAFILTLVMLCLLGAPVLAESEYSDYSYYSVMYNGKYVEFDDVNPQNIDGRIMVPFRSVLESMGATVDYDENTKIITAIKDATTISFSSDNSVISVKNNAGESTFTMDVAPIIQNDRTLVPVRFMAEAFGLDVSWDSYDETAVIMDWGKFESELKEKSGNFYALLNSPINIPENYKENTTGSFSFKLDSVYEDENGVAQNSNINISVNAVTDAEYKDNVINANNKINLDLKDINKLLEDFYGVSADTSIDFSKLSDIDITYVYSDGKIMLKTNLFEQLANALNDNQLKSLCSLMSSNVWLKIDIQKLMTKLEGTIPTGVSEIITKLLTEEFSSFNGKTYIDIAKDAFAGSELDSSTAMAISALVDTYTTMYNDNVFKYNKTGDKGYTLSFNIDTKTFIDMYKLQLAGYGYDQATIDEIVNVFGNSYIYDIKVDCVVDENLSTTSKSTFVFKMNQKFDDKTSVNMEMNFSVDSNLTSNVLTDKIYAPSIGLDVIDLIETYILGN